MDDINNNECSTFSLDFICTQKKRDKSSWDGLKSFRRHLQWHFDFYSTVRNGRQKRNSVRMNNRRNISHKWIKCKLSLIWFTESAWHTATWLEYYAHFIHLFLLYFCFLHIRVCSCLEWMRQNSEHEKKITENFHLNHCATARELRSRFCNLNHILCGAN